jgi:hypothetical protein
VGVSFSTTGSYASTEAALRRMAKLNIMPLLHRCGQEGVKALASATPQDSGLARSSWGYEISGSGGNFTITWTNSDVESGFPVAIMLQYGYGTGTGGYVQGRDYINPAMRPVFDRISEDVRKAVTF